MISIAELKKAYGSHEALKGISLSIKEGEFYGLLGPNGAGKTTTISIMSSILKPDSGTVSINGANIYEYPSETKGIIGVVPQEIALYNDFSAFENLMFWGSLYFVPKQELIKQANDTLKLVGLYDRRNDKVGSYSGGMKRRINIAAALLHKPRVLFMDEPTVGIDIQSRNLIFEIIEQLHRGGMTIVYTTHYMEEAQRLCSRIGIIDDGRIIAEGTLNELRDSSKAKETIIVTFNNITEDIAAHLQSFWEDSSRLEEKVIFYTSNMNADLPKIISRSNEAGAEIQNIELQKLNLETIFLNLTGKQLRD